MYHTIINSLSILFDRSKVCKIVYLNISLECKLSTIPSMPNNCTSISNSSIKIVRDLVKSLARTLTVNARIIIHDL